MKSSIVSAVLLVAALTIPSVAFSQLPRTYPAPPKVDMGKREYTSNCALCHGDKGQGDGPYAGFLTKAVPDLTTLARKNGGVFPFQRIYDVIDGRAEVAAHGMREMPIWGARYRAEAEGTFDEVPYRAPEFFVRARILALNEYLYRLQVK